MTIKIPEKTIGDRILRALGKKRGVHIPSHAYDRFGPHAYLYAQKESFWSALRRPKSADLPKGMIDMDAYLEERFTDK